MTTLANRQHSYKLSIPEREPNSMKELIPLDDERTKHCACMRIMRSDAAEERGGKPEHTSVERGAERAVELRCGECGE